MVVHMDRLIRHLKTQIRVAEHLQSDWVYITLPQARKCLEIAEAEAEREKQNDNQTVCRQV